MHHAIPGDCGARRRAVVVPDVEERSSAADGEPEPPAEAVHREQPNKGEGIHVPAGADEGWEVPEAVGAGCVQQRARREVCDEHDGVAEGQAEGLVSAPSDFQWK